MNARIITMPLFALMISFIALSCGNEKNKLSDHAGNKDYMAKEKITENSALASSALLPGEIALDKLPADINKYIANNYPGYTMQKAVADPLCEGGDAIDVTIAKDGLPGLSLIFKPDGSFVQQEIDMPLSTAPEPIRIALKTRYADYSAGKQIEKLELADKSIQFLVDLNKGNTTKEVIFSAGGNIVCEK